MRGKEEESKTKRSRECCMCGDYGLSHELLLCRSCRFRSQHRYCSNIYPNSDSYDICNWCLDKTPSSSNTASLTRTNNGDRIIRRRETEQKSSDVKRSKRVSSAGDDLNVVNVAGRDKSTSSSSARTKNGGGRRGIIRKGKVDDHHTVELRRKTSEEEILNQTSNGSRRVIVKNRFRTKVRRYKHLDEVSN